MIGVMIAYEDHSQRDRGGHVVGNEERKRDLWTKGLLGAVGGGLGGLVIHPE